MPALVIEAIESYLVMSAFVFIPIIISYILYRLNKEWEKEWVETTSVAFLCFGLMFGIYWVLYTGFYIIKGVPWILRHM